MNKILIYIFILLSSVKSLFSDIVTGPYLQAVTDNYAVVVVECTSNKIAGLTLTALSESDKSQRWIESEPIYKTGSKTYVHKVFINALRPDARFGYSVTHGKDTSERFDFFTAQSPGNKTRFAIMGDCRSNPKLHNKIAGLIIPHNPLFSIYTGDLCYDQNTAHGKKSFLLTTN